MASLVGIDMHNVVNFRAERYWLSVRAPNDTHVTKIRVTDENGGVAEFTLFSEEPLLLEVADRGV